MKQLMGMLLDTENAVLFLLGLKIKSQCGASWRGFLLFFGFRCAITTLTKDVNANGIKKLKGCFSKTKKVERLNLVPKC